MVNGIEKYFGKYDSVEKAKSVEDEFKKKNNLPMNRSEIIKKGNDTKRMLGIPIGKKPNV